MSTAFFCIDSVSLFSWGRRSTGENAAGEFRCQIAGKSILTPLADSPYLPASTFTGSPHLAGIHFFEHSAPKFNPHPSLWNSAESTGRKCQPNSVDSDAFRSVPNEIPALPVSWLWTPPERIPMKRLALCVMSVCLLTMATGCCWVPGMPLWGGCPNGQCGVNPYGVPPQTGYIQPQQTIQTNYAPVATSPVYAQPTTVAFPQPVAPTMAVESLPTYR